MALAACKGKGVEERAAERLTEEARSFLEKRPAPTGRTVELDLVAAPTTLELLDGRSLDVWAYNGQVPGPTIRVREGDTLRVNFTNRLPQSTTIHWHGIRLPNGMDGVPGVTQPPIEPGESFVYEFMARDPGTFWFHPHVRGSEQLGRGLYGVLIVEEADAPPVRELMWVLDDWRLDERGQIDPRFVTRGDLAHDGRWGQTITVNSHIAPEFELAPGERIRLRILNAANGRVFAPDFSAFRTSVLAFDGLSTERPLSAQGLELSPGNRVDLELIVPESAHGVVRVVERFTRRPNLLATIRIAQPTIDEAPGVSGLVPDEVSGAASPALGEIGGPAGRAPDEAPGGPVNEEARPAVAAAPNETPSLTKATPGASSSGGASAEGHSSTSADPRPIRRPGFVPKWEGAEELPPTLVFELNAATGGPFGIKWMINGEVMIHEDGPVTEWHEAPYRLDRSKWAKLRFANVSARLHPMHLHGQFFKVVARNGAPVDEEHWRDTVLVRPRETVDVAVVPTEPGSWMLHCHIMEHQDAGMMTLIRVDDP